VSFVLADYSNDTFAFDDFALAANLPNGCPDLHFVSFLNGSLKMARRGALPFVKRFRVFILNDR
jgi:hypothetical protein